MTTNSITNSYNNQEQLHRYTLSDLLDPEIMDKDLICAICQDLIYKPQECSQCQHVFCSDCISDWKQKRNKCPFDCKGLLQLQQVHRFVRNSLLKLKVKCPDCKEIHSIEKSKFHEKECIYRIIQCDNFGCEHKCRRKSIDKHKMQCEFSQQNNCNKCQHMAQYFNQELKKIQQELIDCKKLLKIEIQEKGKLMQQQQQREIQDFAQFCPQGHEMELFTPQFNPIKRQYLQYKCYNCNCLKHCRYICDKETCQNTVLCLQCRALKFNKILCPKRHKLSPKLSQEDTVCDICLQCAFKGIQQQNQQNLNINLNQNSSQNLNNIVSQMGGIIPAIAGNTLQQQQQQIQQQQQNSQINFDCVMGCGQCEFNICRKCYDKMDNDRIIY
ncbi:TRAF-like protein [Pseudocohnilembus persalinus]|uniref:TRAF-like protein n=1 Tax=Pseudocohnilembus persalinus TaxID=266149 RepID=A0A0V0R2V9_PSEPJ|nr:TRAF-like protein [Pseudocohnilembus persalinus]|eukprot:KRX08862.1 TRAF-like protein [Pseudocohnilembus persalinus]